MEILPNSISRESPSEVRIAWTDGVASRYTAKRLRDACPCATCREKKAGAAQAQQAPRSLPVLSPAEARPLQIEHMRPVGNYAYNIAFSDGHDSGIFTFEFLRELGQTEEPI